MEVVSGLQNAAVHRLKQTWDLLPPKSLEIFHNLVNFLDAEGNFARYRERLRTSSPPIVPYLGKKNIQSPSNNPPPGLFLTDLVFIYDGNPNYIPNSNLINVSKLDMLASTMKELLRYQDTPYRLEKVEVIQDYLYNHPIISNEDELYNLSLQREARAVRSKK